MSPRVSNQSDDGEERVPRSTARQYSQSLERGLAILEWFTPERHLQGIADIADGLGMNRSTTHRYVVTLVELGFMEQVANRKYRLGVKAHDLGRPAMSSTGLREHAHTYLEELRQRTRFTASLAVLDGPDVLYVDRVHGRRRGEHEIGLEIRSGSRLPAYCTAPGKVLLAGLPEQERHELLSSVEFSPRGPNSITTKKALWREIEHVQDEGVAVDDEELAVGLVAVSVPVRDEKATVVAAASLEAPVQAISVSELVEALTPHLVATAGLISARLGYRRPDEVAE